MIVVAARPGMGKTTFGLNMLRTEALNGGNPYFFSIEMPSQQVMMKLTADLANIPFNVLKKANLSDDGWAKVANAMLSLKKQQSLRQ